MKSNTLARLAMVLFLAVVGICCLTKAKAGQKACSYYAVQNTVGFTVMVNGYKLDIGRPYSISDSDIITMSSDNGCVLGGEGWRIVEIHSFHWVSNYNMWSEDGVQYMSLPRGYESSSAIVTTYCGGNDGNPASYVGFTLLNHYAPCLDLQPVQ